MAQELKTFDDLVTACAEELRIQSTDTTNINRIKRRINMVYLNEVVPFHDRWPWTKGEADLTLLPASTGTCVVTKDSAAVTLSASLGVTKSGYYFKVDGHSEVYRIAKHAAGSTSVVLDAEYSGSSASSASYTIWTDRLPLPVDAAEVTEVGQYFSSEEIRTVGYEKFKKYWKTNPSLEAKPRYATLGDWVDPAPYDSISSLPASSTRASAGLLKTIVFASDVSSLVSVGDRIRVEGASHDSYNEPEAVVSSVSTTTVTYTGTKPYSESATADTGISFLSKSAPKANERYRELRVWPAVVDTRVTLDVDFSRQPLPMEDDSDEPLIPLGDRVVLFYGAMKHLWRSIRNNLQESSIYEAEFATKLAKMAGRFTSSTDTAKLQVDRGYLARKRHSVRGRDHGFVIGASNSGGSSSSEVTGQPGVAYFDNNHTLQSNTDISNDVELFHLNGVGSQVVGEDDTNILTNKTIDAGDNTLSNLEHGSEVDNPSSGVHGVTGSIVGTSDTQTLTNKTIDADDNTISNLAHGAEVDDPSTGVHGVTGSVVGTSDSQVLTNKDIDGGTASDTNRITLPKNTKSNLDGLTRKAGTVLYGSDTKKAYLDDGSSLIEVGAGASSGINYVPSESRDGNTGTGDWATFDDSSALVDGTGGTASALSLSHETSAPLRGAGSIRVSKAASDGSNEGVSIDLDTIEDADLGKVLEVSFDYKVSDNYTDEDLQVWLYDITNSLLIQPTPYTIKKVSSSLVGRWVGHFQTPTDSSSYRLIIFLGSDSTTGSAWTLDLDSVSVSPVGRTYGAVVTDVQDLDGVTATWTTNTTIASRIGRIGDYARIILEWSVTGGAPDSADLEFTLPLSIDTAKLATLVGDETVVGYGAALESGVGYYAVRALYVDANTIRIAALQDDVGASSGYTGLLDVTQAIPFTWGDEDRGRVEILVPIAGWSSSTVVSSTADTRVVAATYQLTASNGNTSFASASDEICDFDSKLIDTHGAVTTGTAWKFTAPVPGYYRVSASTMWANTTNLTDSILAIYKNGSRVSFVDRRGSNSLGLSGSAVIQMDAGDYVDIRLNQTDSGAAARNIDTSSGRNIVSIERISGPAQIAASETVHAEYESNASQAIATTTATIVNFEDKIRDTHGAVTTGSSWKFTAPRAGVYTINTHVLIADSSSWAAGETAFLTLFKNGSIYRELDFMEIEASGQYLIGLNGGVSTHLQAGDEITIKLEHTSGLQENLDSNASNVWISILSQGG